MTVPPVDPRLSRDAAMGIVRALRGAGQVAYFAGGCVRDELLGLAPSDYDVATDATPARLKEIFPIANEVGAAFGVVLVQTGRGAGRVINEVATFRSDGEYTDKRRPDRVTFSSPEADARRRDFTMNALFLDPLEAGAGDEASPLGGRVIDYVEGRKDLAARVLRAVGDPEKRLAEDHLRALRAVRLAARLGFTIDAGTAEAIRRHARELTGVSRERIGDELRRMLTHPNRAAAVRLLGDLTLDGPTLNDAGRASPVERLAGLPGGAGLGEALAAWALDRGADPGSAAEVVSRWRGALCLSNDESEDLAAILRGVAMLRGAWGTLGVAAQKRAAGSRWFAGALAVRRAEAAGAAEAVEGRVRELAQTISGLSPVPFVTGDDLIAAGLAPGPAFKRVLDAVFDAQLADRVGNKETALQLARELYGKPGV